jgi:hypothetical protein
MKRYIIPCATLIGANAVFLQIGKRYTPFPALFQFFLNKLVFCAQVEAKRFFMKAKMVYCTGTFKIAK